MNLAFSALKKILPELNERVITPERILRVFLERNIEFYEIDLNKNGYYVLEQNQEYVFLKRALSQLLFHETLTHEMVHVGCHSFAPFLLRKNEIEAKTLALIGMMPETLLPQLVSDSHNLDGETYGLLKRRLRVLEFWRL